MDHSDIDHTGLTGVGGAGSVATDAIWDAAGDLAVGTGADTAAKLTKGAAGTVPTYGASTIAPAFPPGYQFDYAEKTSDTNITATAEASADTVVTGNAVTYDGSTEVMVEFFSNAIDIPGAGASNYLELWLFDGASSIGKLSTNLGPNSTTLRTPSHLLRRLTPSSVAHTYSVRGTVGSGTGSVEAGAGGAGAKMPAFIRITKV